MDMSLTRTRWIAAAMLFAVATRYGVEARAQSADAGYPGGAGGTITNQYGSITPQGPLSGGITGAGGGPMMGTAMQNSMFSNPYAAPMLYNAMNGLTTSGTTTSTAASNQAQALGNLGLMMMLANSQGNQQANGSRAGSATNSNQQRAMTSNSRANAKTRTRAQPAGLAARYFNRTQHNTPYPRTYYNRQSRYYP
jgi:hypothetical protein